MASVLGTYTYQNHNPQDTHPSTHPNHTAIYVGGQNAFFQDNHMAHYRGWTVVACFDSDDQNWGVQSVHKLCHNIPQYMKANEDDGLDLALLTEWFSTKEDAYIAIKQRIDQIFDH